ncbi:MAG: hypothetical protein H6745_17760 [Deltaproteobacteria bacterium]|nr:hypothetical protein [Deltaproteobacteria bacterium]
MPTRGGTPPTALLRRLHCPLCEIPVCVPAKTPIGMLARCGACGGSFRVPAERIDRGTRAQGAEETLTDDSARRLAARLSGVEVTEGARGRATLAYSDRSSLGDDVDTRGGGKA